MVVAVPYPDIFWYHLKVMGTQKKCTQKFLVLLFQYIFHVKSKWNIVYKYLKTKIFSRDTNILPQMHWTSNIFGPLASTIREFWVSLNFAILNFKKTVCPKKFWMRHCVGKERKICIINNTVWGQMQKYKFKTFKVTTDWKLLLKRKYFYNANYWLFTSGKYIATS